VAIEHDYWLRPDGSDSVSATPKEPDDLLRRSEFLLGAITRQSTPMKPSRNLVLETGALQ
jgi:hypothetical protein